MFGPVRPLRALIEGVRGIGSKVVHPQPGPAKKGPSGNTIPLLYAALAATHRGGDERELTAGLLYLALAWHHLRQEGASKESEAAEGQDGLV